MPPSHPFDLSPDNPTLTPKFTRPRIGPSLQVGALQELEINQVNLPIPGLPSDLAGLRILHLTDLHLIPRWWPALELIHSAVASTPPDLIVITGDFVDDKRDYRPALPTLRRFLAGLRARLGIFGILGNHDSDPLAAHLPNMGVTLLDHQRAVLQSADATIELIGLPGVDRRDLMADFLRSIPPASSTTLRIVLCHYPDMIRRTQALAPHLYLTGHTHGGQICLPNGFPPITHDHLPRKYSSGIHRVDKTWLVASRGVGFARLPVRIFCPAECLFLTLAPAAALQ